MGVTVFFFFSLKGKFCIKQKTELQERKSPEENQTTRLKRNLLEAGNIAAKMLKQRRKGKGERITATGTSKTAQTTLES